MSDIESLNDKLNTWVLVQTKPNGLQTALRNLNRQGFSVFCPLHLCTRTRKARFKESWQPLFPGYLFLDIDAQSAPWRKINSTYGVTRLVGFGSEAPSPVPHAVISGLRDRCDKDNRLLPPESLQPGDRVRLLKGPFADFVTDVEKISQDKRVWVLLDLMGRETMMEVEREILQKT